jgi:NhaP-type Na+/H+ or K+/H+ antiporter
LAQLGKFLALTLLGALIAEAFHFHRVAVAGPYHPVVIALLAIGLYSATTGIDLVEGRSHLKVIVAALTVGVLLKIAIIGGVFAALNHNWSYLILGIIVAQIDPLSVSGLMKKSIMSKRAKTILACWSSFDDPITVLLALSAPAFIGSHGQTHRSGAGSYLDGLVANVLYAVLAYVLWRFVKRLGRLKYVFLVVLIVVAVAYNLLLGVAVIGLFIRPPVGRILSSAVNVAYALALLLMGTLVTEGISIGRGAELATLAVVSQVVVAQLLTLHLEREDRAFLSIAQQNGLTAVILSLLMEKDFPGSTAVVAPAIVFINVIHSLSSTFLARTIDR